MLPYLGTLLDLIKVACGEHGRSTWERRRRVGEKERLSAGSGHSASPPPSPIDDEDVDEAVTAKEEEEEEDVEYEDGSPPVLATTAVDS